MGKRADCLCLGTLSDFPHSEHWAERFTMCSAHSDCFSSLSFLSALFGFGDKSSRVALVSLNALGSGYPSTSAPRNASDPGFAFLPSPQKQLRGFLPGELRQNNWLEGGPRAPSSNALTKQTVSNGLAFTYMKTLRATLAMLFIIFCLTLLL